MAGVVAAMLAAAKDRDSDSFLYQSSSLRRRCTLRPAGRIQNSRRRARQAPEKQALGREDLSGETLGFVFD